MINLVFYTAKNSIRHFKHNGAYEPKRLKREKVKEVLLSFRRSLQENLGSECTGCSVTIFEYI